MGAAPEPKGRPVSPSPATPCRASSYPGVCADGASRGAHPRSRSDEERIASVELARGAHPRSRSDDERAACGELARGAHPRSRSDDERIASGECRWMLACRGCAMTADADEAVILARAYLSRVAEPANIPVWDWVRRYGPVAAAESIQAGDVPTYVARATAARRTAVHADDDLAAAERFGIRLVVPEGPEWPHFAFSAFE